MSMRTLLAASGALTVALSSIADARMDEPVFDAPVLAVPSMTKRMNALLDLNGDGFTDAVGAAYANTQAYRVFAFLNDGTGRLSHLFTDEWTNSSSSTSLVLPSPIAVGDFDKDGLDDFCVSAVESVRVYLSNGAAAPTLANEFLMAGGLEIQDLVVADFTGDGNLDAAVHLRKWYDHEQEIRIYPAPMQAGGGTPLVLAIGDSYHAALRRANANGDATADLALFAVGALRLLTVQGGALTIQQTVPLSLTGPGDSADVDNDGDEDLVVFQLDGQYQVIRRTGPHGFAAESVQIGGPATRLADVDGDGFVDGVCCGSGGGGDTLHNKISMFEIAWNDGTGAFAPSFQLPAVGSNEIAGVADLDQDGDNDLVAGRVVYYNDGGFSPMRTPTSSKVSQPSAIVDLDRDGDPDAISGPNSFERNLGDGTFETFARVSPTSPSGAWLAPGIPGDFDEDGDEDLIVHVSSGPFGGASSSHLLLNNGGGGLTDFGPIVSGGGALPTIADSDHGHPGDVDGDGRVDLVIYVEPQLFDPPRTELWMRQLDGSLALTSSLASATPYDVADLDGDGKADTVMQYGSAIYVVWGDVAPDLANLVQFAGAAATTGGGAIIEDVDDDGDPDLLYAAGGGGLTTDGVQTVGLLENQGARSFAYHGDRFAGYECKGLRASVGDVDADGGTDVVLSGAYDATTGINDSNRMDVFLGGTGPGPDFAHAGTQYPPLGGLADLDGDGDADGLSAAFTTVSHAFGQTSTPILSRARSSPDDGLRRQYGDATPGAGGQTPTFGAVGPFLGGGPSEIRITGAAPNAPGVLLVGFGDGTAPFAGTGGQIVILPIIVAVNVVFPSASGEPGSGSIALPYVAPPAAVGFSWYHQVFVIDPQAQGGASVSNGLELYYGG